MGASASSPRPADSPARPKGNGTFVVDQRAGSSSAASTSSASTDDDVAAVVETNSSASNSEPLPLEHPSPEALARMCAAVATLIQGLGEDIGREGLFDTPKRVAKAWIDATSGYRQTVASTVGGALFTEPSLAPPHESPLSSGGIVLVRDVEFASTSSKDLLPFYGKLHIAYVPRGGVVLGLSKVARLAKLFSRRLTTQKELTRDLLAALNSEVKPAGACVLVEAIHLAHGPAARRCVTTARSGVFLAESNRSSSGTDDVGPDVEEFLDLLRLSGVDPLAGGWEGEGGEDNEGRRRRGDGHDDAAPPSCSAAAALPLSSPKEQQHQHHQHNHVRRHSGGLGGRPSARPSSPGEVVSSKEEERQETEKKNREKGGEKEATAARASCLSSSSVSGSPPARPVTPGVDASGEAKTTAETATTASSSSSSSSSSSPLSPPALAASPSSPAASAPATPPPSRAAAALAAQSAGSSSFVHGGEIAAANRSRARNGGGGDGENENAAAAAAAAASLYLPVSPAAAAKRSPPLAPGTRAAMEDAVRALLDEVVGKRRRGSGGATTSSSVESLSCSSSSSLEGAPRRYVEFLLASTAGYGAAPEPPRPSQRSYSTTLNSPSSSSCCGGRCSNDKGNGNTTLSLPCPSSLPLPLACPNHPTFDPSKADFEAVLRFTSQCEHHMLPFHGVARIAVVGARRSSKKPGGPLLLPTLKEVESMVAAFSHRLQVQERLTQQLADGLFAACSEEGGVGNDESENNSRGPAGVLVLCEAAHLCMVSRGVEKHASSTVTLAGRGVMASDARVRRALVRRLASLEA